MVRRGGGKKRIYKIREGGKWEERKEGWKEEGKVVKMEGEKEVSKSPSAGPDALDPPAGLVSLALQALHVPAG